MNTDKKQSRIFMEGEGDSWLRRNKGHLLGKNKESDTIYKEISSLKDLPNMKSYLEIGCSFGYRLNWFKEESFDVFGIEPSKEAVNFGKSELSLTNEEIYLDHATNFLGKNKRKFDIICFAHCLYLIDPEEIPFIISNSINSIPEGGYIVIYDFHSFPHKRNYHHLPGVFSYKAPYSSYFTWYPKMKLIKQSVFSHGEAPSTGDPQQDCAFSLIKKVSNDHAFPSLEP